MEDEADVTTGLALEEELSSSTLAALQQFFSEQKQREVDDENNFVTEDFKKSQFWYDDETAEKIAREILHLADDGGRIGILSAPKVMTGLKTLSPNRSNVYVFDYDTRFGKIYPDEYVMYDYRQPNKIPPALYGTFDVIIFDPPHLDNEAMQFYLTAVQNLSKNGIRIPLIACTGTICRETIKRLFQLLPTEFEIKFISKFCTPFTLYTNYHSELFGPLVNFNEEENI